MSKKTPRVFISYCHEPEDVPEKVSRLCSQLKKDGIDCIIDEDVDSPPQDWAQWMEDEIEAADFVLLVCTEEYLKRFRGKVKSTGVKWEGTIIKQAMYEEHKERTFFIPLLLEGGDRKNIPIILRGQTSYSPWTKEGYRDLYLRLTGQKRIERPKPTGLKKVPAKKADGLFPDDSWMAEGTKHIPWNVPHQRNPFFTGREDVLERIREDFAAPGKGVSVVSQTQAVSGSGGIGKTQTAVEYAYRHRHNYIAVLWTKAESVDDIISGFAQIAALLQLPQAGNPDQAVAAAGTKEWLRNNGGWLLVFDNADTPDLLKSYIPNPLHGHVLLTSRASRFDMLHIKNPAKLAVFPEKNAVEFLLSRVGCKKTKAAKAEAKAVAKKLGYFPLALEQAGAFVLAKSCTFADYLAEYEKKGVALLGEQGPVVGDYPNTVLTTWSVNFEQVEAKSPAAAELLRVCAFLAPEPIPYRLLIECAEHFGPAVQAALGEDPSNLAVANLLAPLADFSLVEINRDDHTFTLHRLVQEAMQYGLGEDKQREFADRAVRAVDEAFWEVEVENWPWCEVLLPHALACDAHIAHLGIATNPAGRLLNHAAYYAEDRARNTLAEPLYRRALAISEKILGPEHPDTGTSYGNLAGVYEAQGKYIEAESLRRKAVEVHEKALGADHPYVAIGLNNLARLYEDAGRLADVEPLYQRALVISEKALGPEHALTATSLNNLAVFYSSTGRPSEAEPLSQRALAIREKVLGPEHPDTATSLNNLAGLYDATDRLSEAEPLYQRALAIREKVLGPEHPFTATSLNNLAKLYHVTGRLAEAESLHQRALAIREKALGPEHRDTAQSLNNLAGVYCATSRLAEAEPLSLRSLAIREKVLGPEHPLTATSLNNLAFLYCDTGRLAEAEPLYKRALAIDEKVLGHEHPDTGIDYYNLGKLLRKLGREAEAKPYLERAAAIKAKHPYVGYGD